MSSAKIIQIIPCPIEMYAEFQQIDDEKKITVTTSRILCLALVEEDGKREIVGCAAVAGNLLIEPISEDADFAGYLMLKGSWTKPYEELE